MHEINGRSLVAAYRGSDDLEEVFTQMFWRPYTSRRDSNGLDWWLFGYDGDRTEGDVSSFLTRHGFEVQDAQPGVYPDGYEVLTRRVRGDGWKEYGGPIRVRGGEVY